MTSKKFTGKKTKTAKTVAWIALIGGFISVMCCLCLVFLYILGTFGNLNSATPTPLPPQATAVKATLTIPATDIKATLAEQATALPTATLLPTETALPLPSVTLAPPPTKRPTWTPEATSTTYPTSKPIIIQPTKPGSGCNPAYPDVCITHDQPCTELKAQGIYNFRVLSPDPYGFDRDNDGIGCEK